MKIRGQEILDPKHRIKNLSVLDKETGCWNWKTSLKIKNRFKAYGTLYIGSRADNTRKSVRAHRYSYIIFIGEIKEGMFICHKCDNPMCVNPDHLFMGTRQDNVNDREYKNRNNHVFGESSASSKLTNEQVLEIIEKYATGKYTQRSLAKEFNLKDHSTIGSILRRETWRHTTPPQT